MKSSSRSSMRYYDHLLHLIEAAKESDRLLLRLAFFAVVASGIWLILAFNNSYSSIIPTTGGSFSEGVVGTPRFVNPVLALTRADQDVTALVYSGLMRISPNGMLVHDVAESITLSEDGLTYNVLLKKDVLFHDNTPLTARDVVYTIGLIQDPDLKSPLRGNWTDVVVEEIGEYELNIILPEPYTPFIENFTTGIMPAHAWSKLPIEQLPFSQLNTEPIGSGPFMVTKATRDTSGLITQYTLAAFRENSDVKIDEISLLFFQNEDDLITAFLEKEIDASTYISTERLAELDHPSVTLHETVLPRTFAIFFNQNRSTALRDASAREALTAAVSRDSIIEKTVQGFGIPTNGPVIITASEIESADSSSTTATSSTPIEQATAILEAGNWKRNASGTWEKIIDTETIPLHVTIRTTNTPLFDAVLSEIRSQWEAIGVSVATEQFEQTGLVQSVIRPRDFEALLFGVEMSRTQDLYPFWHSSQQDDPGLNIAGYTNVTVDELLETARTSQDKATQTNTLREAAAIITSEYPATFLFQPTLTYLTRKNINTTPITTIGRPADRFSNVAEWHTESESLWSFFREK